MTRREVNMKRTKGLQFLSLIICFLVFSIVGTASSVLSSTDDLTVTKVTRLTHPAYMVNNISAAVRNLWNRDYTRIMLFEARDFMHPVYGTTGKGLVWGYVAGPNCQSPNICLTNWTTLAEYQSARHVMWNSAGVDWPAKGVVWSPFEGEENIVYGVYKPDKTVSRLNVDTGVRTPIVSYDPGDGTDVSKAWALGFTTDNTLIVNFNTEYSGRGYEVNVRTGTRTPYSTHPTYCSNLTEYLRWGDAVQVKTHGHGHIRPNGTHFAESLGTVRDIYKTSNCSKVDYTGDGTYGMIHLSWKADNDWTIGNSANIWPYPLQPTLIPTHIFQVYFDESIGNFTTHRVLLTHYNPSRWCKEYDLPNDCAEGGGNRVYSYDNKMTATSRPDGLQVLFTSVDGKYSYEDYVLRGSTPWGTLGFFLADLATTTPAPPPAVDTTPPSTPSGLAAAVISSTQINLSWTASTDNVGIAGYRVYRNGTQIVTTSATSYVNTGLTPATIYTYTVSAYDAAENSSAQSGPVSVTTLSPSPSNVTCDTVGSNSFYGCYFDNIDFTNLKMSRTDSQINFNWGNGSPDSAISSNTFSVRWQGDWNFASGAYRFTATADDGIRIWLDGNLILDKWFDQGATTYTVDRSLSSGTHRIKVEYYENGGAAVVKLKWALVPSADSTPPTTPYGVKAKAVSSTRINLSWTASTDNVGVAGYKIYRNGTQIATTAGTSYANAGLTPSTTYSYTVSAYDAAGNNSLQSGSVSVRTADANTITPSYGGLR